MDNRLTSQEIRLKQHEPISFNAYNLCQAFHFLSPGEVWLLWTAARSIQKDEPTIVNIGAGVGTSSLAFTESRKDAHIYTVDIEANGNGNGSLENERNAYVGTGYSYPTQILGDSVGIGKKWGVRKQLIDLLFVDGEHYYKSCLADITTWFPHVVKGGLICVHDYSKDAWPEVYQATNEAATNLGLTELMVVDTIWLGRKN